MPWEGVAGVLVCKQGPHFWGRLPEITGHPGEMPRRVAEQLVLTLKLPAEPGLYCPCVPSLLTHLPCLPPHNPTPSKPHHIPPQSDTPTPPHPPPPLLQLVGTNFVVGGDGTLVHHLFLHLISLTAAPSLLPLPLQLAGTDFVVGGDGTPLRQFIYADDLATLILRTYLGYKDIDVPRILCPPSSETTIGRVAELIAAAFGITGALRFDPSQPNGQARKTVRCGGRGAGAQTGGWVF